MRHAGWIRTGWRDWSLVIEAESAGECWEELYRRFDEVQDVDGALVVLPAGIDPIRRPPKRKRKKRD